MPAKVEGDSSMPKKPGGDGVGENGGGTPSDAVVKVTSSPHPRKVDDIMTKEVASSSEITASDGPKSCYIDTQEPLPVFASASITSSSCHQNPTSSPSSANGDAAHDVIRTGHQRQGLLSSSSQPQMASPRQAASHRPSASTRPFSSEKKERFCAAQPYVGLSSFPPRPGETSFIDGRGYHRHDWQIQPVLAAPAVSQSNHHQLYHQNYYHPRYARCHAPLRAADRRTAQGTLGNQEAFIQQGLYPFTTSQNHLKPKCLSPVTCTSQEFYYPCTIQQPQSPSTTAVKELEANSEEKQSDDNYNNNHIQNSKVTADDNNRSTDGTSTRSIATRTPRNADTNVQPNKNPTIAPLKPCRAKDREWHRPGNRSSSDSGWISDTSSCSKEDDELTGSPTLSGRLQDVLRLEKHPPAKSSSSLDDLYLEDSHASSTSSQYLSTSDENDGTTPPVKRYGVQPVKSRSMKPIPLRFANLLRAAAECAAERKLRLEGCPLVSHHQNYHGGGFQEIRHPELGLLSATAAAGFFHPPDAAASWYVPQYHQVPEDYVQNQYHGGGNPYSSSYFVQSSNGCLQSNLESHVQNTICSQGYDYSNATQYDGVSPAAQQHGSIDYYGLTPLVPLYVVPVDSVAPMNEGCTPVNESCAMYNAPTVVY